MIPKENCYWYREDQDMKATIPFCVLHDTYPADPPCAGCEDYHSKHNRSNADCYRAMSDGELAKKLSGRAECPDKIHMDNCTEQCEACWLDWLKSPAEGGAVDA